MSSPADEVREPSEGRTAIGGKAGSSPACDASSCLGDGGLIRAMSKRDVDF